MYQDRYFICGVNYRSFDVICILYVSVQFFNFQLEMK